jgi:hypothetical protein
VFDKFEFMILQLTDGLIDLDFQLNTRKRYTASIAAIERYKRLILDRKTRLSYNLYNATNGKSLDLTKQFLDDIIQLKWRGGSKVENILYSVNPTTKRIFNSAWRKFKVDKIKKLYQALYHHDIECAISPEGFIDSAREYMEDLLGAMGKQDCKIAVVDQLFEPGDPTLGFKFFNSPKAIVVDRDPRDHYLFCCEFLSKRKISMPLPYENIDSYIKHYKLVRTKREELQSRNDILFICLEELIYDYQNAVNKVAKFVGIHDHSNKLGIFNPAQSRNNSKLFRKYPGYEYEISKIESELSEFLFSFEDFSDIETEGGMFSGRSRSNPNSKRKKAKK